MITVPADLKQQLKDQRLRQLQAYYYELQMNKTAYEANEQTDQMNEMDRLMAETDNSYQAILNME